MKNVIIKGDFPEDSNIDFTNYFSKEDIGISCRYFAANASLEIYNKLLEFSYE